MVVVPVAVIAEKRVARHFQSEGAVVSGRAISYEPDWPVRARALRRLKSAEVVKSAPGGFYLDEDAWEDRRNNRRKRAGVIFGVAAVVAGLFAAL